MPRISENNFGNMFNQIFYDDKMMEQFDTFAEQYKDISDEELYSEIDRVQSELSEEVKQKHFNNLGLLAQMEGFVPNETVQSIERAKKLIKVNTSSSRSRPLSEREIRRQFVGGASLLLWFLLLVVIWRGRRPFYGRPFRGYPYY